MSVALHSDTYNSQDGPSHQWYRVRINIVHFERRVSPSSTHRATMSLHKESGCRAMQPPSPQGVSQTRAKPALANVATAEAVQLLSTLHRRAVAAVLSLYIIRS